MKKIISILLTVGVLLPVSAFADSSIVITADTHSVVTPSGPFVTVPTGVTQTFGISANSGYAISSVGLDGVFVGTPSSVSLTGAAADPQLHTLFVDSVALPPTPSSPAGGGTLPYCSSPYAPGWNVSLPGGGCGSNETFVPFGHALAHDANGAAIGDATCPFTMGCMVPNK
jgi:hypothetical protein